MTELKKYLEYLLFIFLAYGCFFLYHENRALKRSQNVYETDIKKLETENFRLLDSLSDLSKRQDEKIQYSVVKISELKDYLNTLHYDPTPVDNMHDTDSIYDLFSRVYPDKHVSGERGH